MNPNVDRARGHPQLQALHAMTPEEIERLDEIKQFWSNRAGYESSDQSSSHRYALPDMRFLVDLCERLQADLEQQTAQYDALCIRVQEGWARIERLEEALRRIDSLHTKLVYAAPEAQQHWIDQIEHAIRAVLLPAEKGTT